MAPPFAVLGSMDEHPDRFLRFIPRKNRICFRIFQSLIYLNRGELTKNPTVFQNRNFLLCEFNPSGLLKNGYFPTFFPRRRKISVKQ